MLKAVIEPMLKQSRYPWLAPRAEGKERTSSTVSMITAPADTQHRFI